MTTSSAPRRERIDVLQRVLCGFGQRLTPAALVEGCGGDLSLAGFARCAREHGLEATLVNLSDGDIAYLGVGAIVELADESLATVTAHFPGGVDVERGDGTRRRVVPGADPAPVRALTMTTPAPVAGFFARLTMRLRDEPHVGRALALALFLSVVLSALGVAGPLLMRLAFGAALPNRAPSQLTLVAIGIVLMGVQIAYVGWLRRSALLYLSTKLGERSTIDLVAHSLRLPLSVLRAHDVGGMSQTVTAAATAGEAISNTLAPHFVDAVLGGGLLIVTFVLDPWSGLLAGGLGALVISSGYLVGRRRLALKRTLLARRAVQQRVLHETFAGIESVKAETVEGKMLTRWIERLIDDEEAALSLHLQRSRFETLVDVVDKAAFAAVLLFLATRCLEGTASIADLVAALQASTGFMTSAVMLARLPSELAEYKVDEERVAPLLLQPTEGDLGGALPADAATPALALRDVWFRYDDDSPWVLLGANLVVQRGERAILSWPSGAGKSTLLRVLSGLVPPTRGDVLVFGRDASRSRKMIAYVPQQATVFAGSIIDNLRILSGGARTERILEAAEATGLMAMVSEWPMGIETWVFAGSTNVSSGQCQLIVFTAAVASDAPIVVLDEALSHMDVELRTRLAEADLFRGRTVISVLHDALATETSHGRVVSANAIVGLRAVG